MKKIFMLAVAAMVALPTITMAQKTTIQRITREKTYETQTYDVKIWYEGSLMFGYATGGKMTIKDEDGDIWKEKTDFSRPFIETVHGVRITKYGYAGLGLGVQYAYGKFEPDYEDSDKWNTLLMPIFLNLKGYYPVNNTFAPYVSVSLGSSACLMSNWNDSEEEKLVGGFYGKAGIGFSYKKFMFDFGLMHQGLAIKYTGYSSKDKLSNNSFYVNLGVKF